MTQPPRRPTPRPVYDRPTAHTGIGPHPSHLGGLRLRARDRSAVPVLGDAARPWSSPSRRGAGSDTSPDNPTVFARRRTAVRARRVLMLSDPSTGRRSASGPGRPRSSDGTPGTTAGPAGTGGCECSSSSRPLRRPAPPASTPGPSPTWRETLTLDRRLLGSWPVDADKPAPGQRITPVRESDLAWGFLGEIEAGFFAATEHLTVFRGHLRAGAASDQREDPGETFVLLLAGELTIRTPAGLDANCLYLKPGDAAVLPPGTPHSHLSSGDAEAVWLTGVGPGWTADAPPDEPGRHRESTSEARRSAAP